MTDIADMQASLERATEMIQKIEERGIAGQLALELMHEIRNPLEALIHLVYLAKREAGDPEAIRKYMHLAEEQTFNLRQIVNQTLGFARSSNVSKPMDLIAIAEAALRIHQQRISAKKIHLVRKLPERLIAHVYTSEILQAISNLVLNAIDALPDEGTLHLRFKQCGDRLYLLVADNGRGIPTEHVATIFQPFFTTKGEGGNGLGLTLTRRIVDRHKGTIAVRSSVRPGKSGTIFRVSLPLTA